MDDFCDFYRQQTDVVIQVEAIEKYAAYFIKEHTAEFIKSTTPLQFPLQFPSLQEEINLLALKELLMVIVLLDLENYDPVIVTFYFGCF